MVKWLLLTLWQVNGERSFQQTSSESDVVTYGAIVATSSYYAGWEFLRKPKETGRNRLNKWKFVPLRKCRTIFPRNNGKFPALLKASSSFSHEKMEAIIHKQREIVRFPCNFKMLSNPKVWFAVLEIYFFVSRLFNSKTKSFNKPISNLCLFIAKFTGRLTVEEQKLEGEFRYVNSRLITNSEEVNLIELNFTANCEPDHSM